MNITEENLYTKENRDELFYDLIDTLSNINDIDFEAIKQLDRVINNDELDAIVDKVEEYRKDVINSMIEKLKESAAIKFLKKFIEMCDNVIADEEQYRSKNSIESLKQQLKNLENVLLNIEYIYENFDSYQKFIQQLLKRGEFQVKRKSKSKVLSQQEARNYFLEKHNKEGLFDLYIKEINRNK